MSNEKINDVAVNNNETEVGVSSGVLALSEMADDFDREKAEKAVEERKQEITEKDSEKYEKRTRIIKGENGNNAIESDYFDLYYDYKKDNEDFDSEFGKELWNLGFKMAMLDLAVDSFEELDGLASGENDDSWAKEKYQGVFDAVFVMADEYTDGKNADEIKKVMDKIGEMGGVGETVADCFDASCDACETLKGNIEDDVDVLPKNEVNEFSNGLSTLDAEYAELRSGKSLSSESVNSLYAKYGDLAKRATDAATLERINERKRELFDLNQRLEEINKKIAQFD